MQTIDILPEEDTTIDMKWQMRYIEDNGDWTYWFDVPRPGVFHRRVNYRLVPVDPPRREPLRLYIK